MTWSLSCLAITVLHRASDSSHRCTCESLLQCGWPELTPVRGAAVCKAVLLASQRQVLAQSLHFIHVHLRAASRLVRQRRGVLRLSGEWVPPGIGHQHVNDPASPLRQRALSPPALAVSSPYASPMPMRGHDSNTALAAAATPADRRLRERPSAPSPVRSRCVMPGRRCCCVAHGA